MRNIHSFENYSQHAGNEDTSADSVKSPDNIPDIYTPEEYIVPEGETKTWCSYMEREFRASRILTGKETGSRADASERPAEGETFTGRVQPGRPVK